MLELEKSPHPAEVSVTGEPSPTEGRSAQGPGEVGRRVLVAYGSRFGNTRRLAEALARGLSRATGFRVECRPVSAVAVEELDRYDLVAVGGPTEMFSASREVKEFLDRLEPVQRVRARGFAFETKLASRLSGSAGRYIERHLARRGVGIVRPYATAIVRGMTKEERVQYGDLGAPDFVREIEPPTASGTAAPAPSLDLLAPGAEDEFERIGVELSRLLPLPVA